MAFITRMTIHTCPKFKLCVELFMLRRRAKSSLSKRVCIAMESKYERHRSDRERAAKTQERVIGLNANECPFAQLG